MSDDREKVAAIRREQAEQEEEKRYADAWRSLLAGWPEPKFEAATMVNCKRLERLEKVVSAAHRELDKLDRYFRDYFDADNDKLPREAFEQLAGTRERLRMAINDFYQRS